MIKDERISILIRVLEEYGLVGYTQDEAEELLEIFDKVNKEINSEL